VGENPTLNLNPTLNPKPNPDRYPYPGTSWQPTWALGGGPATAADLPRPRDHGASRGSSTSSQTELSEISELSEGSVMASDVVPSAGELVVDGLRVMHDLCVHGEAWKLGGSSQWRARS